MGAPSVGTFWATLIDEDWNGGGYSSGSLCTVEPGPSGEVWHMWQPAGPSATDAMVGMTNRGFGWVCLGALHKTASQVIFPAVARSIEENDK